jgi:hypothetical protein
MEEVQKDVQINSISEKEFFVDEVMVTHGPLKMFIDFKNTTPLMDMGKQRLTIRHQVCILDPFLAKDFLRVLKENIDKYEKQFGEIKKPESLQKLEKEAKKKGKESSKKESYFG